MQWMGSMEQDGVFTEVEMGSKCALLWSMLSRPGSRTGLRGRLVDAGSIGGERDGFMESNGALPPSDPTATRRRRRALGFSPRC